MPALLEHFQAGTRYAAAYPFVLGKRRDRVVATAGNPTMPSIASGPTDVVLVGFLLNGKVYATVQKL